MTTSTLILIIVIVLLLGGGGGYYMGPWRGGAPANHLVGVIITVLVIAVLLRLLGVY
jgi:hypothetical protein